MSRTKDESCSHSDLDYFFDKGLDIPGRRVFLHGGVETADSLREYYEGSSNDSPIENVIRSLLWLDQQSSDTIELWINSPGGLEIEMFGVYDIIQSLHSPVRTVGFGEVCSAAGLLLACGAERYAFPNCFFLSHLGESSVSGDIQEITSYQAHYQKVKDKWAALMAAHTKHTKKFWLEIHNEGSKRELWLDTKEMIRHGIIDDIWKR